MRILLNTCILLIGILADIFSKQYFEELGNKKIPVLGDFLAFQLAHNSGVAFSLPVWGKYILPLLTLSLLVIIVIQYIRNEYTKNSRLLDFGYSLLLSWGFCHLYERTFQGFVTDFIAVKYFAIFNIADIMISVGTGLILFFYFRHERTQSR